MSTFFDNSAKLDLDCPECGRTTSFRLGDLRRGSCSCPGCGVAYDASKLDRTLRDLDLQLRRFGR